MVELKEYCDEVEIEFMSTPFDVESANFLNDLMDVFKISSSDITNKPFIEKISSYCKPIILSTGASDLSEIEDAVSWIQPYKVPLALLHCVLNYPTDDSNANLGMISGLKSKFPSNIVGYSDHTLPDMMTLGVATMLGCQIIEKHFTHDKNLPGNDHYHAMDVEDLQVYNTNLDQLERLFGKAAVVALDSEKESILNARRSLVSACNIGRGEVIKESMLTFKRPGHGISPAKIDSVINRKAAVNISEDEILQWNMLD